MTVADPDDSGGQEYAPLDSMPSETAEQIVQRLFVPGNAQLSLAKCQKLAAKVDRGGYVDDLPVDATFGVRPPIMRRD